MSEDESLKLTVSIKGVSKTLFGEVGAISAHSLDECLRRAEVPVAKAGGGVNVAVNIVDGQLIALVTSTTHALDINRRQGFKNLLHRRAEVAQTGSHADGLVISRNFFVVEGGKVFDTSSTLINSHVSRVRSLEGSVLARSKICNSVGFVFRAEGVMNHTNARVSLDAQTNEDSHSIDISLNEIRSAV